MRRITTHEWTAQKPAQDGEQRPVSLVTARERDEILHWDWDADDFVKDIPDELLPAEENLAVVRGRRRPATDGDGKAACLSSYAARVREDAAYGDRHWDLLVLGFPSSGAPSEGSVTLASVKSVRQDPGA
jgi:hypothetical protein